MSQKIITVFHEEWERIPPAIWFATAQPIYAVAFNKPATVLTLPYFANFNGIIVISITLTANIQFVTIIIEISDKIILFDEKAKRTIKNTSAIAKNTADVLASFLSLLFTNFAKNAPVTLTTGKSIVKRSENEVFELN